MAFNGQGGGVGKFDVNVGLVDTGEIAEEFVAVGIFTDVKFWRVGAAWAVVGGWVVALGGRFGVE